MNRFNKDESAVFLYCSFSLFLKDPFFPDCLGDYIGEKQMYGQMRTNCRDVKINIMRKTSLGDLLRE